MPAVVFTINLWTPVLTHVPREVEACVSTASTIQQADSVRYARRDSTGNLARALRLLMCAHLVDVRGLGFSLGSWNVLRLVHYPVEWGK